MQKRKQLLLAFTLLWAIVLLRLPDDGFWQQANHSMELILGRREFDGIYVSPRGLAEIPQSPVPEIAEGNIAAVNAFAQAHPASRVYLALVPHKIQQEAHYPEELTQAMVQIPEMLEDVTWVALSPGADGYYATDSHWNARGAARGWASIAGAMGLDPGEFTEYCLAENLHGSLAQRSGHFFQRDSLCLLLPQTQVLPLDAERLWDETQTDLFGLFPNRGLSFSTTAGTGRSLLIVGDEWAGALVPLVYPHFDRIAYALSPTEEGFTDVIFLYGAESFLSGAIPGMS